MANKLDDDIEAHKAFHEKHGDSVDSHNCEQFARDGEGLLERRKALIGLMWESVADEYPESRPIEEVTLALDWTLSSSASMPWKKPPEQNHKTKSIVDEIVEVLGGKNYDLPSLAPDKPIADGEKVILEIKDSVLRSLIGLRNRRQDEVYDVLPADAPKQDGQVVWDEKFQEWLGTRTVSYAKDLTQEMLSLRNSVDVLNEIVCTAVRESTPNLMGPNIGLRQGWKVVELPTDHSLGSILHEAFAEMVAGGGISLAELRRR